MSEEKMEKQEKTIFVVVDISHKLDQQINTVNYAANLAKLLSKELVVFMYIDTLFVSDYIIESKFKQIREAIVSIDIVIRLSYEKLSLFNRMDDIIKIEKASFCILGVMSEEDTVKTKIFGSSVWRMAQKIDIPLILVPQNVVFNFFKDFTIAVDSENKIQKASMMAKLTHDFNPLVNIFVSRYEDRQEQNITNTICRNIENVFDSYSIVYTKETARISEHYLKHLLRFTSKNSKLLVLEVDKGKISNPIKSHIEQFLFDHDQTFAVMMIKTKSFGIPRSFNGS